MRISKHTFQDYCDDSHKAQKMMSLVAAKLPTKTMVVSISRRYNTTNAKGMASIATVDAMDALGLCALMLKSNHPKVNKDIWVEIQSIVQSVINKELANDSVG